MNQNTTSKVLIVIPAWNEERSIGRVLDELKALYSGYDIIVINDGSKDSTAQIAKEKKGKGRGAQWKPRLYCRYSNWASIQYTRGL